MRDGTAGRDAAGRDRRRRYAPRLTKEDGLIDWTQPAARIHNLDARPASVAARVHVPGRPALRSCCESAALDDRHRRGARHDRRRADGDRARRRGRGRRRPDRCRFRLRASGRWPRASSSPAISSTPGDRVHAAAMIAPARVAAYEILAALSGGPRGSPDRHRPRPRRGSPTSATARWPPRSRPASQRWRAALDHLIAAVRQAPDRAARSGGRRHPAPERVPAAPPRRASRRPPSWTTR